MVADDDVDEGGTNGDDDGNRTVEDDLDAKEV